MMAPGRETSLSWPKLSLKQTMLAKIVRWAIFTFAFSLIPIVVNYISGYALQGEPPPISELLKNGELYLLAASFSAVGLGEVIGANQTWQLAKIVCGGFSALMIGFSTLLYAFSNNSPSDGAVTYLANLSSWIFIFSCVIAVSCIVLSEVSDA